MILSDSLASGSFLSLLDNGVTSSLTSLPLFIDSFLDIVFSACSGWTRFDFLDLTGAYKCDIFQQETYMFKERKEAVCGRRLILWRILQRSR